MRRDLLNQGREICRDMAIMYVIFHTVDSLIESVLTFINKWICMIDIVPKDGRSSLSLILHTEQ